jgi:F-type H+-transporting ATPase subunit b
MPQIDVSTFLSQAFWLLVCFCTLWGLLSVCITPKLTDIIEQRKRKINDFIQKAENLRRQAEQSLQAYNQAVTTAKETVEKEIADCKRETEAYLKQAEKKLNKELNKKILANEVTLEKEKELVSQQIGRISQDLAFDIVNKLGFGKISRQDIAKIADKESIHG